MTGGLGVVLILAQIKLVLSCPALTALSHRAHEQGLRVIIAEGGLGSEAWPDQQGAPIE
jgi:hypothetical protein